MGGENRRLSLPVRETQYLACMMLFFLFLSWLNNSTPGHIMVADMTATMRNISLGKCRVSGGEVGNSLPRSQLVSPAAIDGDTAHACSPTPEAMRFFWVAMVMMFVEMSFITRAFPRSWFAGTLLFAAVGLGVQMGIAQYTALPMDWRSKLNSEITQPASPCQPFSSTSDAGREYQPYRLSQKAATVLYRPETARLHPDAD